MQAAFNRRRIIPTGKRRVHKNPLFRDYLGLPQELRTMVINRMKPKTRLRFADCSNICREDVLKSKNIIDKVTLYAEDETLIECAIDYVTPSEVGVNQFFGFKLVYRKQEDTQTLSYVRMNENWERSRTIWTSQLGSTTDSSITIMKFKTLLKKLRHKVRHVGIYGNGIVNLEQLHSDAVSMTNVEKIYILDDMDFCRFLEKTHRPLKKLSYEGEKYTNSIPNCALVYSCKEIDLPHVNFTYEQLTKMSAEIININIGQLSVKNIINYVKGWINGERDNLEECKWNLKNSNFNVRDLFHAFGSPLLIDYPRTRHAHFMVSQTSNPRVSASVQYVKDREEGTLYFLLEN